MLAGSFFRIGLGLGLGLEESGLGLGLGLDDCGLGLALGLDCCRTCYKSALNQQSAANYQMHTGKLGQSLAKMLTITLSVQKISSACWWTYLNNSIVL